MSKRSRARSARSSPCIHRVMGRALIVGGQQTECVAVGHCIARPMMGNGYESTLLAVL